MDKKERRKMLEEFVNQSDEKVSVSEIADHLEISHSYAYSLAMEAMEDEAIDGDQSTPVIGYVFEESSNEENDIEVLVSRKGLLWAVKQYAPERLSDAQSKETLQKLRTFVRQEIADATVPVNYSWRLYSMS